MSDTVMARAVFKFKGTNNDEVTISSAIEGSKPTLRQLLWPGDPGACIMK